MPRQNYDEELAHHQEGVLDIMQRAGIQVLWNENDGGCKEPAIAFLIRT
jgi:lipid A ethanolaminephosphotransferase